MTSNPTTLRDFLEVWTKDSRLQTFSSREQFRREAEALLASLPTTPSGVAKPADLHNAIMNLQVDHEKSTDEYTDRRTAYIFGHRDARHAAAELVAESKACASVGVEPEIWMKKVSAGVSRIDHSFVGVWEWKECDDEDPDAVAFGIIATPPAAPAATEAPNRPMCRDCADFGPICPNSGKPCATPAPAVGASPADEVARIVHLRTDLARRVYIAGPMTGLPEYNFPAFNAKAAELRAEGWHVENPAEHGHVEGAGWADYLRWDISRIATCGAIYLLPGWEASKGANLEVHIGKTLGIEFLGAVGASVQPVLASLSDEQIWDAWARACNSGIDTGDIKRVDIVAFGRVLLTTPTKGGEAS